MQRFKLLQRFIKYFIKADTIYGIHSPFAASIITAYFNKKRINQDYIQQSRSQLLKDNSLLELEDYGAGSKKRWQNSAKVSSIARLSLTTPRQMQQIGHITALIKPAKILELGTSFGLSAMHLQAICPTAEIVSIEGNRSIAQRAIQIIEKSPFTRKPVVLIGRFHSILADLKDQLGPVDLVFIDGDHTLLGTMNNLNSIMPFIHNDSAILLHDIYWSEEMQDAWNFCKKIEGVTMSLDFFDLGVLFFKREFTEVQHFTIAPYWMKPWKIGIF